MVICGESIFICSKKTLARFGEGYYHHYSLIHVENSNKVIEGLQLIFVELPKFTPHNFTKKKMQTLWLRYLTEIDDETREAPTELLTCIIHTKG